MHRIEELEILGDGEEYTKVTFRMKRDTVRKLKVHCAQNDTNITDVITKLVEDFLSASSD